MKEALSGIRVLDLSRVLSGPFCTSILSDFGAEVIKIEQPNVGDETRDFFPKINGESGYFVAFNRGKKGVTLDLKHQKGKQMIFEMVKTADVVVSNFRPGVMEKLGLNYDVLKTYKSDIIYATISGFGSKGPYASRGGYDTIAQAMSGLMSLTGFEGSLPTRIGASVADVLAGLNLAVGILAAIRHKEMTGQGQAIEVSLVDAAVVSIADNFQSYFTDCVIPTKNSENRPTPFYDQIFKAIDGYLVICGLKRGNWDKLCLQIGKPDWCLSDVLNNETFEVEEIKGLNKHLDAWIKSQPCEHVLKVLGDLDIPTAPILDIDQAIRQHYLMTRGMLTEVIQPNAGKMVLTSSAIKTSQSSPYIHGPAPLLGENNQNVYQKLMGISAEEYQDLLMNHII